MRLVKLKSLYVNPEHVSHVCTESTGKLNPPTVTCIYMVSDMNDAVRTFEPIEQVVAKLQGEEVAA